MTVQSTRCCGAPTDSIVHPKSIMLRAKGSALRAIDCLVCENLYRTFVCK